MNKQTFFDTETLKNGEYYFKKGLVKSIKKIDGFYHVNVVDTALCNVKLKIDIRNQITIASCTCEVGRKGIHCKHEAAAYLAIQADIKNKVIPLRTFYQNANIHTKFQAQLDVKMNEEVKNRINNIIEYVDTYDSSIMQNLIALLNEYIKLKLTNTKTVFEYFKDAFIKLFNIDESYQKATYQWLKKIYLNNKYHLIDILCQNLIKSFKIEDEFSFYTEVLENLSFQDNKLTNWLFLNVYRISKQRPEYTAEILERLNKYDNSYIYQRLKIENLIEKKEYNQANDQIKLAQKKLNLDSDDGLDDLRMDIALNLQDKEAYKTLAIKYTIEHENHTFEFPELLTLKNIFKDNWSSISKEVYSALSPHFMNRDMDQIIVYLQDANQALHEILNRSSVSRLETFKSLLLENYPDVYFHYLSAIIQSKANQAYYPYQCFDIVNSLKEMVKEGCPIEGVLTLVYQMLVKNDYNEELTRYLERYKDELEEK